MLQALLDTAGKARTAEACGEAMQRFPIFPESEADARQAGQYVYEGWQYYCTPRAAHPRSTRMMSWSSVDRIAAFNGFNLIHMISPRPLLMIVGTKADTRWMTEDAFAQAGEPKALHWIDGATHVDLYDKAEYVVPAVAKLSAFYRDQLGK
ncbi:alpha/beta hydrolase [Paraburkholderia agricolaris]|uniref:alpha/beta hydrolase n=1 Tax=Paraburkholderia agricolaris TaxID=2152888 RepID=UPI001C2BC259